MAGLVRAIYAFPPFYKKKIHHRGAKVVKVAK
jgi:hypothetical protein